VTAADLIKPDRFVGNGGTVTGISGRNGMVLKHYCDTPWPHLDIHPAMVGRPYSAIISTLSMPKEKILVHAVCYDSAYMGIRAFYGDYVRIISVRPLRSTTL
jgi:hypothetical protein